MKKSRAYLFIAILISMILSTTYLYYYKYNPPIDKKLAISVDSIELEYVRYLSQPTTIKDVKEIQYILSYLGNRETGMCKCVSPYKMKLNLKDGSTRNITLGGHWWKFNTEGKICRYRRSSRRLFKYLEKHYKFEPIIRKDIHEKTLLKEDSIHK